MGFNVVFMILCSSSLFFFFESLSLLLNLLLNLLMIGRCWNQCMLHIKFNLTIEIV